MKTNDEEKLIKVFIRLMKILDDRLILYLFVILTATGSMAGFGIVSAYLLKDILNMAQSGDTSGLWQSVIINMIIGIGTVLFWRWSIIIYNVEAKRGIAKIERAVFAKAIRFPVDYYEIHHSGDFISRLIFDTNRAGDVFGSRFRRLIAPAITAVVYFIPMMTLCWQLTLSLLAVSIVMFISNAIFVKPMKNVSTKISKENSVMSEKLTNLIAATDIIKMFNAGEDLSKKYEEANNKYKKHLNNQNRLGAMLLSSNEALEVVCIMVFILLGIYFLKKGTVQIGTLGAVYSMYGIFRWNFLQLGRYMPEMSNSLINARRVFEFLDIEEEKERYDIKGAKSKAYIAMENLKFSYNEEREILSDFSMEINKGERVALIGPSGKGKSTILKLLLGFYEPQEGRISINGKAYGEYTLNKIRDIIGYVPQEPYLYTVSIAENIRYGKPEATMEEIIQAAKSAQAHEFIMGLENGYDTIAGERGSRLSGGEKQRIAIARAILKNAPILILDEATSALDNESERLVSAALEKLMEGKTTIMIAHRPATIQRAERIIELG